KRCGSCTVQPMSTVESPDAEPSNARTIFSLPSTTRSSSLHSSRAPNGSHESEPETHWPRRSCLNTGSRSVLRADASPSRARNGLTQDNAGLATFHACSSLVEHPAGAEYSFSQNDLSVPSRPCSTSRHITDSCVEAGVEIASVNDSGLLPVTDDTASQTASVTTCISSTISNDGSQPCNAFGSAGSGTSVE